MSTPKNTKLTLKRIIEGMDQISDKFGTQQKKLSGQQIKRLQEMVGMYENLGKAIKNEEAIMNSAKSMTELCELAETYALSECGDVFQENIVQKDMKELKKRVMEYQKVSKECYARMQQLGVAYEDIGHYLGRYYDLKGNPQPGSQAVPGGTQQPVTIEGQVSEDLDVQCAWCKKPMGKKPGTNTGTSHGICDKCSAEMEKDLPPAKPSQTPNKP